MAWFDALCPDLLPMSPGFTDQFITKPGSRFAVIVHDGFVVGYCTFSEVWMSRVLSIRGEDALAELLERRARNRPAMAGPGARPASDPAG